MRLARDRDLLCGVVFVAIGAAALALGTDLTMGTAADMGEGYVPRAMAVALIGLGGLIVLARMRAQPPPQSSPARREEVSWRPLVFVTTAVLVFAAALEPLGLIAAMACSAIDANFSGRPLRATALALLISVLSLVVVAVFVWGLGLPLKVLPRIG